VRAIVLIVALALWATHAGLNLSSNTNAVSDLAGGDVLANSDNLSNDLVSNADRSGGELTPSSGDGVNV
jgi:hypothetical protein